MAKPDYQVGVIALTDEKETRVALVTTRSGARWTFPKGQPEEGRSDKSVAEEEAYEEAGIIGFVKASYQEFGINFGRVGKLRLYRMEVRKALSYWPEKGERKRVLAPIALAESLLEEDLRDCLRQMLP